MVLWFDGAVGGMVDTPGCEPGTCGFESRAAPHFESRRSGSIPHFGSDERDDLLMRSEHCEILGEADRHDGGTKREIPLAAGTGVWCIVCLWSAGEMDIIRRYERRVPGSSPGWTTKFSLLDITTVNDGQFGAVS